MDLLPEDVVNKLVKRAMLIYENRHLFPETAGLEFEQLVDVLYKVELDKKERDEFTDGLLEYNDEIVSIERVGDGECLDITVTGDNLFYANGVLTKNSIGLPATVDFMVALISSEELEKMGQLMIKQLKNRFGDPNLYKRFVVGIDRSKMKLYDLEPSAQRGIDDNGDNDGKENNNSGFGRQPRQRDLSGIKV